MYDTWLAPWHTEIVTSWDYTSHFCNTPELPRGWYDWMTQFELEEHKMPWLSLAEYIEQWVLRVPETLLYKFI